MRLRRHNRLRVPVGGLVAWLEVLPPSAALMLISTAFQVRAVVGCVKDVHSSGEETTIFPWTLLNVNTPMEALLLLQRTWSACCRETRVASK